MKKTDRKKRKKAQYTTDMCTLECVNCANTTPFLRIWSWILTCWWFVLDDRKQIVSGPSGQTLYLSGGQMHQNEALIGLHLKSRLLRPKFGSFQLEIFILNSKKISSLNHNDPPYVMKLSTPMGILHWNNVWISGLWIMHILKAKVQLLKRVYKYFLNDNLVGFL